jgi:ABC-type transport system substrate-binding protein
MLSLALRILVFHLLAAGVLLLGGCGETWNDPYPRGDRGKNYLYEFFNSRPKHLDPAQSYVEDEAWFVSSTYESLYEYHYLKRPYTLIPNLAQAMPTVSYLDAQGKVLPQDAAPERIAQSVYEIRLRPGIRYQPHPAFAKDEQGNYRYFDLDDAKLGGREQIGDFEFTGTRELTSEDLAYQIKRFVRPRLESPALSIFTQIVGLEALGKQLEADAAAGKIDPDGWIDLRKYALAGVETPDPLTLRIRLKGKYPQFIYWLATTFVVPMPWEAERFYAQPGMARRELTLDMWPVGTGPFMLTRNRPLRELLLERNPNFREQTYPCEGEPGDAAAGLLKDCGKRLPFVDGVRFSYERESIPFWNKFLQGYYDFYSSSRFAGMATFDAALQLQGGALSLTEGIDRKSVV